MTHSIRKKQKQLRKQDKPQSPYAQAGRYWPRELRNRDRWKDVINQIQYRDPVMVFQ